MEIIKRNGKKVEFNKTKIKKAVIAAMRNGSGIYLPDIARLIANDAEKYFAKQEEIPTIQKVEDYVHRRLIHYGQDLTAKAYEGYRAIQAFKKESNDTDEAILGLVRGTNEEAMTENSNKNAKSASTQRDLVAGEVSKSIMRRRILPAHFVQAHDDGILHYHDMDYGIQPIFNCCLVNMEDVLQNGTVINGKGVDTPKSFRTACTIATQVMAQVASGQYGGQTTSLAHLAPFVRVSFENHKKRIREEGETIGVNYTEGQIEAIAAMRTRREVKDGVQTIQYQINTLATSNGQSPFVSLFMHLEEAGEYEEEMAIIIEEVLRQRIQGIKNEQGVYITPAFPKLLYVLDESNAKPDSKYYYLTELAAQCFIKRLVPDFISAKVMRENTGGYVYPCMGCRSFLSPWFDENGNAKFYGRFNMGVVSLNLPDIALSAEGDFEEFVRIFEQRTELCKEMLLTRVELLKGTSTDISPIHWRHGALARLTKDDTIDSLLENGYASISLGYVGLHECVKALTGETHTSEKGEKLALEIMNMLRAKTDKWKEETGYGFGLYGTPAESLVYKFARKTKERFGEIEGVTDKLYFTNSYHVHVQEEIDAFSKLKFESQFQKISSGGCISYVETPNLSNNITAALQLVDFIYENIQYAEINTKSDYCQCCSYDGEIEITDDLQWRCPNCGNMDTNKMNVCRRTCGYLGENFWNLGRTQEIKERVMHL